MHISKITSFLQSFNYHIENDTYNMLYDYYMITGRYLAVLFL